MDNETLVLKIPAAANELGEAAKKIEEAAADINSALLKLKASQEANARASSELREAVEELKRRANIRDGEGGKK